MAWGLSVSMDLLASRWVELGSGLLGIVLAGVLLHAVRQHRAALVFGAFLLVRSAALVIGALRSSATEAADVVLWANLRVYGLVAMPFLVAAFVALFPRSRGWWGRPAGLAVILGGAVLADAAYLVDHGLFHRASVQLEGARLLTYTEQAGPLWTLLALLIPAYGVAALVFARDAARAAPGPTREALLLVSLGFGLDALFLGSLTLLRAALLGPTSFVWEGGLWNPVWAAAVVPVLAAVALLARAGQRQGDASLARAARIHALACAAVLATAGATTAAYALGPRAGAVALHGAFDALWTVLLPVLVTYALLRHRLFDAEVKAKRALRGSAIVGVFAGFFFLGSEAARALAPGAAAMVGVGAALTLFLALQPLTRMADRLADRVLPGADAPARLNLRKLDVYRAALEDAAGPGGQPPPPAEPRLLELRAQLGITERDHAVLAMALQHRGASPSADLPLEPGEVVLHRYEVVEPLGAGAHGRTYLARDRRHGAEVVLKALRPGFARDGEAVREAEAMRAFRHPGVVELHELALEGAQPYLVMEHVQGGSLRERLREGPLAPEEFQGVARSLLGALGAVHAAGLVHRDVKPANVLLDGHGGAKLGDFGLAHLPGMETTVGPDTGPRALGTIPYMSPEQARGQPATHRSDLYGAAATLYEAWTGTPYLAAREGESAVELQMRAARGSAFRRPVRGPPALRAWFARALHPRPGQRFASAHAMRDALERALGPATGTRRQSTG